MIVIIQAHLPEEKAAVLCGLSPRIELIHVEPGEPWPAAALRQAEVIYTSQVDFDPRQSPRLRWVQLNTAAANQMADNPILGSGVVIATASGAYSVAVAECALAMLLALTRRVPLACRAQMRHEWRDAALQGEDLHGKTMGIIGYGSIGRQIARVADAMGMVVLACKSNPQNHRDDHYLLPGTGDPEGVTPRAWFGMDEMQDVLRQSDIAMVTLPLTEETRGVIGRGEIEALPPHAYFVNVGRGPVVDESALLDALQNGRLAGAGLDVFEAEPLPPDSPFWDLPNVLVMPHVGSWTTA
ncbi:MAG TPA: D-2-hydroxyacid dehydrogenase, partial [Abditibacteriaceae bacterium]|nr:D-2-hydroxyacid dehydrogenase [Abditibacteriaceae bacterium]